MRHLVLFIMTVFLLTSCSGGSGKKAPAEIKVFSLNSVAGGFAGFGNFRLYAETPSGDLYFSTDISGGTYNTDLEHGNWNFYVIGWANDNFMGPTSCGRKTIRVPEDLIEGKTTIALDDIGCNDPYFSPPEFMVDEANDGVMRFQKLKISFCDSKFELHDLDYDSSGNWITDDFNRWDQSCEVEAGSFRIGFIDYDKQPRFGATAWDYGKVKWSNCMAYDPQNPIYDFRLPVGQFGNSPIKYVVEGFSAEACNTAADHVRIPITRGLLDGANYNFIKAMPGQEAFGDPYREYISFNINIAFVEQIGMRMSPTKVSLGDRPIPSVFSRTVTLYNESPEDLQNCVLKPFTSDRFSSPDFETNCSTISYMSQCQFDLVADLNSVPPNVGIKSPIGITCDGGSLVQTGEDGFLVCPGGNCTNGDFESDLAIQYVPEHLGNVVVGETPNFSNGGGYEIEIRNDSDETTYTGCNLSFSGAGVDAFTHAAIINQQTPGGCLSNLNPQNECRVRLAPIPTQVGDQEVSVVLACDQDTSYYLENTTAVTGILPLLYEGSPLYGAFNGTQDGKSALLYFDNESQSPLSNCVVQISDETNFELVDKEPNGQQISASEFCGTQASPQYIGTNNKCKLGLVPKAGAAQTISTDVQIFCDGSLAGEVTYTADRAAGGLPSIIVAQESAAFQSVEIPFYGDDKMERKWTTFRNNSSNSLFGCHIEIYSQSSTAASDAIHASPHWRKCEAELVPGDACEFAFSPSRFPWEGTGALVPGNHNIDYTMVCDSIGTDGTITQVNSPTVNFSMTVTDGENSMRLAPNFYNFGFPNQGDLVGPTTITLTNISSETLTGCGAPSFYINGNDTDPNAANFEVSNNTCPGTMAPGASCSFDLGYRQNNAPSGSVEAEMEIRCDFDRSVRTSSNWIAHFQNQGGGSDQLYGKIVYGFPNNAEAVTGDVLNLYVYTYGAAIFDSGSYDTISDPMDTGTATFEMDPATSTHYRLDFKYTIQAGDSNTSSFAFGYTNSATYRNPQTGTTYNSTNFNFDGGSNRVAYVNETVPPYIVSISSPNADQTYYTGDEILVDVTYSEAVVAAPFKTTSETGTIDCASGTGNATMGTGSQTNFTSYYVGQEIKIGATIHTITSIQDDSNMMIAPNCTSYDDVIFYAREYRPQIVLEPGNYGSGGNGHVHLDYNPQHDDTPVNDNVVRYKFVIPGDFYGTGFKIGSDGNLSQGVFSVANPTLQASNIMYCSDLSSGQCLDQNTNFVFVEKPVVTSINSPDPTPNGSSPVAYFEGDKIRFNVNFSNNITVGTDANLRIRLVDDFAQTSYATFISSSDNGDSSLQFEWIVPANFYAQDLEIDGIEGLSTEVTTISDGTPVANIFPKGNSDYNSFTYSGTWKIAPSRPKIVNITAPGAPSFVDGGQTQIIRVEFSEDVNIELGDLSNVYFTLTADIGTPQTVNATDASVSAEAMDGDNIVDFLVLVPQGYFVAKAEISNFYGLESYVTSVKSGLTGDYDVYPKGPSTLGSLSYNQNLQLGNKVKVVNVTRTDANGALTTPGVDFDIQVTFNQNVLVTGSPRIKFYQDDGVTPWYADYISGSGTSNLLFRKNVDATIISNTNSQDLAAASFDLNGGTLRSGSNSLDFFINEFPIGNQTGSLSSNENVVIGSGISITSITGAGTQSGSGFFMAGDVINFQINFSAAVTKNAGDFSGIQMRFHDDAASNVYANYVSGDGTTTLNYSMTVPANMNTKALQLVDIVNKNLIVDNATSTTPISPSIPIGDGSPNSLKSMSGIVIGSAPVLSNVSSVTANGSYGIGDFIEIRAIFDQDLGLDPANAHNIRIGFKDNDNVTVYAPVDVAMPYSNTLKFDFQVPPNMNTNDLTVFSVEGLQYVFSDKSGIPTSVTDGTWPKGAGTSLALADNFDFIVGGPAPTISSFTPNTADGAYFSGQNISVVVNFSVPVSIATENEANVKLKFEDDAADDYLFATLNSSVTNTSTAYFDLYIPYNIDFSTIDLKVVEFMGAEFVKNNASDIALNLTSAPYTGTNSLQDNAEIQILQRPKITHFTQESTPANSEKYMVPTVSGDELVIRVHYSENVQVASADAGTIQLSTRTQNSYYAYGSLVGPLDTPTNYLDFEFNITDSYFETNQLMMNGFSNGYNIKIASNLTEAANDTNYPVGADAGSIENLNIAVSNLVMVEEVTSDESDAQTPFPNKELVVKVKFNTQVRIAAANIMNPFIRANGANGTFAEARIDQSLSPADTNSDTYHFRFNFPDEFSTTQLRINFVNGFSHFLKSDSSSAQVFDVPKNGAPNSLSANKNFVIEEKDPMTHYGSGVDGDITINEELTLSVRDDIVKDKDNQKKYAVSFFKVKNMQFTTTPEPHHIIDINPNCVNCSDFQQADGAPATVTTIEQNDVVMWYVSSEKGNACGSQLAPGMFGFLMATNFESATRAHFAPAPGVNVSLFGGAFLPTGAGLPSATLLQAFNDSPDSGLDIANHCSIQMARVFMPRVLQLGALADVVGSTYSKMSGVGGILPIKVKEVLDLSGRTNTNAVFDMRGSGFRSQGYQGFSGHTGWGNDLIPVDDQTGGISEDPGNSMSGGGAGWRAGGDHEGSVETTGGYSPEMLYCAGNCYPASNFNEMKYAFMGSPGASTNPGDSVGGGVLVLHAKKAENGRMFINVGGVSTSGGGAGAGSVYIDFETMNQFGSPGTDLSIQVFANGSSGTAGGAGDNGSGGGGHINVRVCNNNNSSNADHNFSVSAGTAAAPYQGMNGLAVQNVTTGGGACLTSLPE